MWLANYSETFFTFKSHYLVFEIFLFHQKIKHIAFGNYWRISVNLTGSSRAFQLHIPRSFALRSTPFFIVRHPLLHKATLRKDVIALFAITIFQTHILAQESTTLGIHAFSYHNSGNYNDITPGLYLERNHFVIGAYHNSIRNTSFYAGYTWDWPLPGGLFRATLSGEAHRRPSRAVNA